MVRKKTQRLLALFCAVCMLIGCVRPDYVQAENISGTPAIDADLTRITFSDFGVADGSYNVTNYYKSETSTEDGVGAYGAKSTIDGSVFSAKVTFPSRTSGSGKIGTLSIGGSKADGKYGNAGLRITNVVNNDKAWGFCFYGASGTVICDTQWFDLSAKNIQLSGRELLLQMTFQLVDEEEDGQTNDLKLGIWIDGTFYSYLYFKDCGAHLGNMMQVYAGAQAELSIKSVTVDTEKKDPEKPDAGLKQITFRDFGIADGGYHKDNYVKSGIGLYEKADSLDGTMFSGYVTFPTQEEGKAWIKIGGQDQWGEKGIEIGNNDGEKKNRLSLITNSMNETDRKRHFMSSETAGCTLIGEKFFLQVSLQVVAADEDEVVNDIKVGVWFNGKLYDNEYIYLKDCASDLGNHIQLYSSNTEKPLLVESIAIANEEKLNPDLKKITFSHFGIQDGTYTYFPGDFAVSGTYKGELNNTVFCGRISFSSEMTAYLRIGGKESAWKGLSLTNQLGDGGLSIRNESSIGNGSRYKFNSDVAGTELLDNEFDLKLSFEVMDTDGDGAEDDVKLGVWFNDVLYNDTYIFLTDYAPALGSKMGIYCGNENTWIKVSSIPELIEPFDYARFGLTKDWKKTLNVEEKQAISVVGGSIMSSPYTGDETAYVPLIAANIFAIVGICLAMRKKCKIWM